MEAALDQLEEDTNVWIGIVTGEGPVFSAGADLKAISAGQAADPVRWNTSTESATRASWSPSTDCSSASHSARNSRTARTLWNPTVRTAMAYSGEPFAAE